MSSGPPYRKTLPDRPEDPALHPQGVAELLGVAYNTVRSYHAGRRANFPMPDGYVVGGRGGVTRPYWYRSTIRTWEAQRPGRGRHAGRKSRESAA